MIEFLTHFVIFSLCNTGTFENLFYMGSIKLVQLNYEVK